MLRHLEGNQFSMCLLSLRVVMVRVVIVRLLVLNQVIMRFLPLAGRICPATPNVTPLGRLSNRFRPRVLRFRERQPPSNLRLPLPRVQRRVLPPWMRLLLVLVVLTVVMVVLVRFLVRVRQQLRGLGWVMRLQVYQLSSSVHRLMRVLSTGS